MSLVEFPPGLSPGALHAPESDSGGTLMTPVATLSDRE